MVVLGEDCASSDPSSKSMFKLRGSDDRLSRRRLWFDCSLRGPAACHSLYDDAVK